MELVWILCGLLGWTVAMLLLLVLMQMAGRQDQIARRVEMEIGLGSRSPDPEPGSRTGNEDGRRIAAGGPNQD